MSNNNNNSNNNKKAVAKQSRQLADPWEAFWGPIMSPSYLRWDLAVPEEGAFLPAIDIHEDDKAVHVDVELAGIPKEDIHLEVHEGVLTVSGEKKYEKKEEGQDGKVHRVERRYGSFKRSIGLPDTADPDKIDAKSANGVLHITVSKKPPQTPAAKKIAIQ